MISLFEEPRRVIAARFREEWHHVGCALRTRSGRVFAAVHLEAKVGRVAVCAEAVALGMGAAAGDTEVGAIVAVGCDGEVMSPCGICRKLISDYAPAARVIVPVPGGVEAVPIAALLPHKSMRGDGA